MPDRGDANRLSAIGQLIENPVGADPQGVKTAELPPKRMTGERVALEQPQRILDRVDQPPAQFEQLPTSSPGKYESCQRSAGGRAALGQLVAKLGEGDRLAPLDLGKPPLQGRESVRVGEDLRGLLQRLILVDRDESRSRRPIARDQHVIAPIADVIQKLAEIAAQLSHWDRLRHQSHGT